MLSPTQKSQTCIFACLDLCVRVTEAELDSLIFMLANLYKLYYLNMMHHWMCYDCFGKTRIGCHV